MTMSKQINRGVISFTVFALAGSAIAAGSLVFDGNIYTLAADADGFSSSASLASATKLVKTGIGEASLSGSTSAFSGDVEVLEGTLTITSPDALGPSAAIVVKEGATFNLQLPVTSNGLHYPHVVTIAGSGVNGNGAFRYTKPTGTGTSYDDSLLAGLNLADDAVVSGNDRWGLKNYNNKEVMLCLNGHELRKIGSGEFRLVNMTVVFGSGGRLVNAAGLLGLQGAVNCQNVGEGARLELTGGATLSAWGLTGELGCPIRSDTGCTIRSDSGTFTAGDVEIVKASSSEYLTLTSRNSDSVRPVVINGSLVGTAGFQFWKIDTLKGDMTLNGAVSLDSVFFFVSDNLWLKGDNKRTFNGLVLRGGGRAHLENGYCNAGWLRIANGGLHEGAFYQTGGVLSCGSDSPTLGETGGKGFFVMDGGEAHFSNTVYIAKDSGGYGAFVQRGGLFDIYKTGDTEALSLAKTGSAMFHVAGGTNDSRVAESTQKNRCVLSRENGEVDFTVSGTGSVFRTDVFYAGGADSNAGASTNVLSLADGGTLEATRFFANGDRTVPATRIWLNVDGGVLRPSYAWKWTGSGWTKPGISAVVQKGGVVIDTSVCSNGSGGTDKTQIDIPFSAPTGDGIETISLTDAVRQTKLAGPTRLVISSATGYGASAYLDVDAVTGLPTNVVITARGCNYTTANATVSVMGHPELVCPFTCTPNIGGPLVKIGSAQLSLEGENSYSGGTMVEEGELIVTKTAALPDQSPIKVANGAILNLNGQFAAGYTATSLSGTGFVKYGNLNLAGSLHVRSEEVFGTGNPHLTAGGLITLRSGASVIIDDPENLDAFMGASKIAILETGSANGIAGSLPVLCFADGRPHLGWKLKISGQKLMFGYNRGQIIFIR